MVLCWLRCRRSYLIEARWRMATSRAWTESRGTCTRPLIRVSCSRRQDTLASQRIDTLKIRSFPSPGMVTSKSTCRRALVLVWSELQTTTWCYCGLSYRLLPGVTVVRATDYYLVLLCSELQTTTWCYCALSYRLLPGVTVV